MDVNVMIENIRSFPERLKKIRRAKVPMMTMEQIGYEIGTTRTSYAAIENGSVSPRLDMVYRIAKALDCDPVWLCFGDIENTEHRAMIEVNNKQYLVSRLN